MTVTESNLIRETLLLFRGIQPFAYKIQSVSACLSSAEKKKLFRFPPSPPHGLAMQAVSLPVPLCVTHLTPEALQHILMRFAKRAERLLFVRETIQCLQLACDPVLSSFAYALQRIIQRYDLLLNQLESNQLEAFYYQTPGEVPRKASLLQLLENLNIDWMISVEDFLYQFYTQYGCFCTAKTGDLIQSIYHQVIQVQGSSLLSYWIQIFLQTMKGFIAPLSSWLMEGDCTSPFSVVQGTLQQSAPLVDAREDVWQSSHYIHDLPPCFELFGDSILRIGKSIWLFKKLNGRHGISYAQHRLHQIQPREFIRTFAHTLYQHIIVPMQVTFDSFFQLQFEENDLGVSVPLDMVIHQAFEQGLQRLNKEAGDLVQTLMKQHRINDHFHNLSAIFLMENAVAWNHLCDPTFRRIKQRQEWRIAEAIERCFFDCLREMNLKLPPNLILRVKNLKGFQSLYFHYSVRARLFPVWALGGN
jgi:hypothetical protein